MPSTAYHRGLRFEYRVQRWLRRKGWFVVRQPRSAFPDLVALDKGRVMLIECKMGGSLSRKERREIVKLARHKLGGEAILASRNEIGLTFKRISMQNARHDNILMPSVFDTINLVQRRA
jgi:Holliday junction resolvase